MTAERWAEIEGMNFVTMSRIDLQNVVYELWAREYRRRHPELVRPTIVCLCGSTRFLAAWRKARVDETLAGKIVLTIANDQATDDELVAAGQLPRDFKARLDELHLRKVELADEVLILNVDGYIGESTQRELLHALELGKRIRYLEPPATEPPVVQRLIDWKGGRPR